MVPSHIYVLVDMDVNGECRCTNSGVSDNRCRNGLRRRAHPGGLASSSGFETFWVCRVSARSLWESRGHPGPSGLLGALLRGLSGSSETFRSLSGASGFLRCS